MSRDAITDAMRRDFASAERIAIGDTALARPALRPTERSLRAHFASPVGRAQTPLENPHLEPRVSQAERARAVPAAVLLAIVMHAAGPRLIVTRRPPGISFPGHWVFPGGRCDAGDASPQAAALREAEEEIGLDPGAVEVLGRLGDYTSHSGFRIAASVALVPPTVELRPNPQEVEAIAEIELARVVDSASYFLYRFPGREDRAHFALHDEREDLRLTGVTASIAICFYSELLKTHAAE